MTDTTERGETLDELISRCVKEGWMVKILTSREPSSVAVIYGQRRSHTGYADTPLAALNAAIAAAAAAGHTIGEGMAE